MNIRTRTTINHTHTANIEGGEVELEFEPLDGSVLAQRVGDKLVVAYLSHDNDCANPLDDCDGVGKVIGRGKYETRDHSELEMFEALALDRGGDPDFGLVGDKVRDAWEAYLNTLDRETWVKVLATLGVKAGEGGADDDYVLRCVDRLRDEMITGDIVSEGSVLYAIERAERYLTCMDPSREQMREAADFFEFDPVQIESKLYRAELEAGRIGDRDAVLLDVYDHSGLSWSIHGGGMQCRWDTSGGAGVWLPDDTCRAEIELRAPVYARYFVRETRGLIRGRHNKYQLVQDLDGREASLEFGAEWVDIYNKARTLCEGLPPPDEAALARGRRRAAEELAQNALDEYNDWLSGACYGCVVEEFELQNPGCEPDEAEWHQIDIDHCWGYIGEYAEEALKVEHFNPAVKRLNEENEGVAA